MKQTRFSVCDHWLPRVFHIQKVRTERESIASIKNFNQNAEMKIVPNLAWLFYSTFNATTARPCRTGNAGIMFLIRLVCAVSNIVTEQLKTSVGRYTLRNTQYGPLLKAFKPVCTRSVPLLDDDANS